MPRTIYIATGLTDPPYSMLTAEPVREPLTHSIALNAVARGDGLLVRVARELAKWRDRSAQFPVLRLIELPVPAYEIRDADGHVLGLCLRPGAMHWLRAGEWLSYAADGHEVRLGVAGSTRCGPPPSSWPGATSRP